METSHSTTPWGKITTILIVAIVVGLSLWAALRPDEVIQPEPEPPAPPSPPATAPADETKEQGFEFNFEPVAIVADGPIFRDHLAGVAVDREGTLYAVGDQQVRIFDTQFQPVGQFDLPAKPRAIAVGKDKTVYVGLADRVEKYSPAGQLTGTIGAGKFKSITGMTIEDNGLYVADGGAGRILRFTPDGGLLFAITPDGERGRFRLPNGYFDAAAYGPELYVAHTGPHTVEIYDWPNTRVESFGGYDPKADDRFPGCCNPTNIAADPGDLILTAQKAPAMVKLFTREGELLGLLGEEYFHKANTHMDLAIDTERRLFVADTENRRVRVFKVVWHDETKTHLRD